MKTKLVSDNRKTLFVSTSTHTRMSDFCKANALSMNAFVDRLIDSYLDYIEREENNPYKIAEHLKRAGIQLG